MFVTETEMNQDKIHSIIFKLIPNMSFSDKSESLRDFDLKLPMRCHKNVTRQY